jgi:hypothetical protein
MRNHTLTTALVILLVLPVLAGAATLDSISGTADCNGGSADKAAIEVMALGTIKAMYR